MGAVNRFFILPDICNKLFFPVKLKDNFYAFTDQTIFCSHPLKHLFFSAKTRTNYFFQTHPPKKWSVPKY